MDQDAINRFKEVFTVEDHVARGYLQHCDGSLENAINLYLQTGGTLMNTHEGVNNHVNEERVELRRRNVNNVRTAAPPVRVVAQRRPQGWLDWLMAVVAVPVRFTFSTLWDIFSFFATMILGRPMPAVTDPRGDVRRFLSDYKEHYAPGGSGLPFSNLSYDEALREAKSSLKMLLVYLHNPNCKDTVPFVQNVLHSEAVRNVIASNHLLVWGVSLASPQGLALSSRLRPNGFPFICLQTVKNNKMDVALRLSGMTDADTAAVNLTLAIEDHRIQMNILRAQKAQREEDQRIRAEQEKEYAESVAKDKAKMKERRRLESERAEAEELERQTKLQFEARKETISAKREEFKNCLAAEPTDGEVIRVQVRFPSGASFNRKFRPDDPLENLFLATLAQQASPDYFTVHTTYPRKELICAPQWYHEIRAQQLVADGNEVTEYVAAKTFREEGLMQPFVVMVHDCLA